MHSDVLVVGGGISGLATAWWLKQAGLSVVLWERDSRTGGKIKSVTKDGYTTEQAASLLMNFRPDVEAFINKAGLESLKSSRSGYSEQARYLMNNGQLQAAPMSVHGLLMSDIWSFSGKLRLLSELFVKSGGNENESVSEFITRRFGAELLEKAMEPFVAGTLASDPDLANAWAVLPRLTALEQKYGRISLGVIVNKLLRRKTAMVNDVFSFRGGMESLTQHLSHTLNGAIHRQHSLCDLQKSGQHWLAHANTPQGEKIVRARHVVMCTPAENAAQVLAPVHQELSRLLAGIDYAPLTLVHMGFKQQEIQHPLNGTGFLVPRKENLTLSGNLWMSSLFNQRAPEGRTLLSSYLGGARRPEAAAWDDQKSTAIVYDELVKVLGIKGKPEMIRIDRHQRALPLYHGQYFARCQQIRTCLKTQPGLHLGGNYLGGVSIRERLACSRTMADQIIQQISAKHPERPLQHVNQLVPIQV